MTNYYYSNSIAWYKNGGTSSWETSTLNNELNGSSFSGNNTYIDGTHRGYIANGTWYKGGVDNTSYTFLTYINAERNSNWVGMIGLISVVDFGYASSSCTLSTNMNKTENECMSNNWIGYDKNKWTINPYARNSYVFYVSEDALVTTEYVGTNCGQPGTASCSDVRRSFAVQPALYLESDVKIVSGSGTETDPYILSK